MKTQITSIVLFFLSVLTILSQKQPQEILLVGTMHVVPKIVNKSYQHMLRFAKKYNPETI